MSNTTVSKLHSMQITVQTMIDSGYTYRKIMEKTGLSSPSHVKYYADNKHRHWLTVVDSRPGREIWACPKCHQHFQLAPSKEANLDKDTK